MDDEMDDLKDLVRQLEEDFGVKVTKIQCTNEDEVIISVYIDESSVPKLMRLATRDSEKN
jgi:hypothetical protein